MTDKIVHFIETHADDPAPSSVIRYGVQITFETVAVILPLFIISLITADFFSALLSCTLFMILRYLSGGLHFKKPLTCNVLSILILLISIYVPIPFYYIGAIMTVCASLIFLYTAPSNTNRRRIPVKYNYLLKTAAVAIVLTNLIFQSSVYTLTCFIQSITTIPYIWKYMNRYKF
ncbi:accessory gene regulator B family protein [Paenibacillus sp. RC84]|uniref:accessory gene regulator B family protein n=1 Tax=Paenibacillus sp. RC84 TaxID=3156252 RepID=UPI0035123F9A